MDMSDRSNLTFLEEMCYYFSKAVVTFTIVLPISMVKTKDFPGQILQQVQVWLPEFGWKVTVRL